MKRRIYVASSWRNTIQPSVVEALRADGHEVYDFRNPAPGEHGFSWEEIDPNWKSWTPRQFEDAVIDEPLAQAGFARDKEALDWCDLCVLVMPSGRSAHLEAGYAAGRGKEVIVMLSKQGFEPELMYQLCAGYAFSIEDLRHVMAHWLHKQPV